MVSCMSCGFEVTDDSSKFCPKCGKEVFQKSKTDSTIDSVSNIPTKTPSKKGTGKLSILLIVGIVVMVIILLPSIIGFDEAQNANNFEKKKMECDANADWIYIDTFENFCCTSEKYTVFEGNGLVCPSNMKFIYP